MTNPPPILTDNALQARALRDEWAQAQQADGKGAWERPRILSLGAWLRQLWGRWLTEGVALPHLLSADQEHQVWAQTLPELPDHSGEGFFRVEALYSQAARAYQTLCEWGPVVEGGVDWESVGVPFLTDEQVFFRTWAQAFENHCREANFTPQALLTQEITTRLASGEAPGPVMPSLARYRTVEVSPAERKLLAALEALGTSVSTEALRTRGQSEGHHVIASDPAAERHRVATWIRAQLAADPTRKIAWLVPDLAAQQSVIKQVLEEALIPRSCVEAVPEEILPFRFEGGRPLESHSVIPAALWLLDVLPGPVSLEEAGRLLRSPWLLPEEALGPRAMADAKLRKAGQPILSLDVLQAAATEVGSTRFAAAIGQLSEADTSPAMPAVWARRFRDWAQLFQWSSNAEAGGVVLAAYDGWRDALDRLASLGTVCAPWTLEQARAQLRTLVARQRLQVPRVRRPAVTVMAIDNAAGLRFDRLWISGLHDQAWPSPTRLNPFLPLEWQRENVPDAREGWQRAVAPLRALTGAAEHFVVSAPESDDDSALGISPFVRSFPPLVDEVSSGASGRWYAATRSVAETVVDERGPALHVSHSPEAAVVGGTSILSDQAQCPFRAFARHRLYAYGLEEAGDGLNQRERGNLVHSAMQEVWKALGQDQAQLLALSESALETRVQDAVARVLDRFADAGKIELGPGFRANEQVAIVGRVLGAMTLDRLRTTPFVVEEMERKRTGRIGPLTVKLQMDRVDRLADGRRVLVDYKTGKASPSTWEGERPKDLQLPIYAGLLENVGGLFFVQVREEEQAYLGSQADASVTNGLPAKKGRTLRIETPEDWSGQLARWGEVARKLAQDFVDGEAAVDPLESRSGETCQYCGLQSFCRVVPGGGQGV